MGDWGNETPRPTSMNFGILVDLADLIKFGSFGIDRLRSLGSARGRKLGFPILNELCP